MASLRPSEKSDRVGLGCRYYTKENWVPNAAAPQCMRCDQRFSFFFRRCPPPPPPPPPPFCRLCLCSAAA